MVIFDKPYIVIGTPIPAPRMTKADKWKKRPAVLKYYDWGDKLRKSVFGYSHLKFPTDGKNTPKRINVTFVLPIPPSTSNKRVLELEGKSHEVRPDLDNLIKGLLDSLYERDSVVHSVTSAKRYSRKGEQPGAIVLFHAAEQTLVNWNFSINGDG